MAPKLTTIAERLRYVTEFKENRMTIDDIMEQTDHSDSAVRLWMKSKEILQAHVKAGFGNVVRVTAKRAKLGHPPPPKNASTKLTSGEITAILSLVGSLDVGGTTLKNLVACCNCFPTFKPKTFSTKAKYLRRLLTRHCLIDRVRPGHGEKPTIPVSPPNLSALPPHDSTSNIDPEVPNGDNCFTDVNDISTNNELFMPIDYSAPSTCSSNSLVELSGESQQHASIDASQVALALTSYTAIQENQYSIDLPLQSGLATRPRSCPSIQCSCAIINGNYFEDGCTIHVLCCNVMANRVCPESCKKKNKCRNQLFTAAQTNAPHELFFSRGKGIGVRSTEFIPQSAFVIEYVGEVITKKEFERRFKFMSQTNATNYYFCGLKNDLYIDACYFGNNSRFINHSCEPNSIAQLWNKNGLQRIAIFAAQDIECGEEIMFDYNWFSSFDAANFDCQCGAVSCSRQKVSSIQTAQN
ncbi:Aste57867_2295 [Aphanomyces stellatus]|uniref:Aste57867_2295 protein n=1 Tax=Aphanomyces stellatus TaxID=120398 RepID=A0A485KCF8_9STRA|nr:hypothetical protein As57867_002290 [Aphanomyces stellatus]VFT79498.1 Aste57867_2295 [Aphanomyces stellatus]